MKEMDLKDIQEAAKTVDRAIVLCDKFTPVTDRNPTQSGGSVRTTAVGMLVAVRAMLEALIEEGSKGSTP